MRALGPVRTTPPDQEDASPTRTVRSDSEPPSHERLGRIRLRVLNGTDAGREFKIPISRGRLLRGGRNAVNDIVLMDEQTSGFHFSLEFDAAGIVLRDLGSTNGVFVRGVRVREAVIELDTVFFVAETSLQITGTDNVSVPLSVSDHFGAMYGWSPVMRELFAELDRVAALPSSILPVLITGETGTGKELVARGLHERSVRAKGPFIVLDCTAIPRELADAIVFGHTRGAFSGAVSDHAGVFEQAHGGTLFIDELGELPLELQAKLLRVLDRGEVCRFNEQSRMRKVDVRVISATNRDLRRMVAEGRFREDLFFRVFGKNIELPSLRERGDDVVHLAVRFLATACERLGGPPKHLTPAAYEALRRANWQGNVRHLQKVIECAAQLTTRAEIDVQDLQLDTSGVAQRAGLQVGGLLLMAWEDAQAAFQREYLKALMQRVGTRRGWINHAAALAGMDRGGFVRALKRLDLYRHAMEEP